MPASKPSAAPDGFAKNFWSRLDNYASLDKLERFSFKEMFSEVFRKRTAEDIDDYFLVGSYRTTPSIESVASGWPKPWFFGRVLLFVAAVYAVQYYAFQTFQNILLLPGMMVTGALAMPLATAFLFFELNAPRNVSFHRTLTMVCAGGVLSIFVSLVGFELSQLATVFGAPAAGVVEETGKLLVVILIARKLSKNYILNGCLFGAAVGAGFASFESAGYAFRLFLRALLGALQSGMQYQNAILIGAEAMAQSIVLRGALAPFGHVAWTAISTGVLWRARAQHQSLGAALRDRKFLRAYALVMALHAIWNLSASFPGLLEYPCMAVVGIASWYVALGVVQQGLRQVRAAQIFTTTMARQVQTQHTSA